MEPSPHTDGKRRKRRSRLAASGAVASASQYSVSADAHSSAHSSVGAESVHSRHATTLSQRGPSDAAGQSSHRPAGVKLLRAPSELSSLVTGVEASASPLAPSAAATVARNAITPGTGRQTADGRWRRVSSGGPAASAASPGSLLRGPPSATRVPIESGSAVLSRLRQEPGVPAAGHGRRSTTTAEADHRKPKGSGSGLRGPQSRAVAARVAVNSGSRVSTGWASTKPEPELGPEPEGPVAGDEHAPSTSNAGDSSSPSERLVEPASASESTLSSGGARRTMKQEDEVPLLVAGEAAGAQAVAGSVTRADTTATPAWTTSGAVAAAPRSQDTGASTGLASGREGKGHPTTEADESSEEEEKEDTDDEQDSEPHGLTVHGGTFNGLDSLSPGALPTSPLLRRPASEHGILGSPLPPSQSPGVNVPLRESGQVLAERMREERRRLAKDQRRVAGKARRVSVSARAAQAGAGWFEVRTRRRSGKDGALGVVDDHDDNASVSSVGSAISWASNAWRQLTGHDAARPTTNRPFMVGDVVVPPAPEGVSDSAMLIAASEVRARKSGTHNSGDAHGLHKIRAAAAKKHEQKEQSPASPAPSQRRVVVRRARKRRRLSDSGRAIAVRASRATKNDKTSLQGMGAPAPSARSRSAPREGRNRSGSAESRARGMKPPRPAHSSQHSTGERKSSGVEGPKRRGGTLKSRLQSARLISQASGALSTSALAAQVTAEAAEGAGLMSTAGRILEVREDILTHVLLKNEDLAERLATNNPAVLRRRIISEHALLEDAYLADIMPTEQRASLWDMDDEEAERYVGLLQKSQASGPSRKADTTVSKAAAAAALQSGKLFAQVGEVSDRQARGTVNSGTFLVNALDHTRAMRGRLGVLADKTASDTLKERGVVDENATAHQAANVARHVRASNAHVPDEAVAHGCCYLCCRPRMSEKRRLALSKYHQVCAHVKHTFVEHRYFQAFVILVIVLAAAKEGAVLYDLSPAMEKLWKRVDTFAIVTFVLECLLKIAVEGLKPWRYFMDSWNLFDFVIVGMALIPGDVGTQFAVFRLLRVLRVLKLIRAVPKLRVIVNGFLKALSSIGYVSALLALEFYLFSAMAVTLLGSNDPKNFGSLHLSLLSLWAAATGDDWTDYMYTAAWGCDMSEYGGGNYADDPEACIDPSPVGVGISASFFIVHYIIGSMVLLNLFIGVLMLGMQEAGEEVLDGDSLEVHLINAEGVAEADFGQKSDPYAILSIPSLRSKRSRTVTRTLNPLWDKLFVFNNLEEATSTTLDITVFDWDRLTADDKLGFVSINFAPLQYGVTYVYELRLQADSSTVVKRFTDDGADDTSANNLFQGSQYKMGRRSSPKRSGEGDGENKQEEMSVQDSSVAGGSRMGTFFSSFWKRSMPVKRVQVDIPPDSSPASAVPPAATSPVAMMPAAARLTRTPRRFAGTKPSPKQGARKIVRVIRPSEGGEHRQRQTQKSPPLPFQDSVVLGKRTVSTRSVKPPSQQGIQKPSSSSSLASPSHHLRVRAVTPSLSVNASASGTTGTSGGVSGRLRMQPASSRHQDEDSSEDGAMSLADIQDDEGFIRMPDQGKIFFKVTKRMSPAHSRQMRMADATTVHGWDKLICLTYRAMGRFHEVEKIVEQRRSRKKSAAWEGLQRQHARVAKASQIVRSSLSRRISAVSKRKTGYGRREDVRSGKTLPMRGGAEHPKPGPRTHREELMQQPLELDEEKTTHGSGIGRASERRRRSMSEADGQRKLTSFDATPRTKQGVRVDMQSGNASDSSSDGPVRRPLSRRASGREITRGNKRLLRLRSRRSPGSMLQTMLADEEAQRKAHETEEVVTPKQLDMLAQRLGMSRDALFAQIGGQATASAEEEMAEEPEG